MNDRTDKQSTVIWLTGLSGAGKTTLAKALFAALRREKIASCILDGDEVRRGLCADLGFSAEDRRENVRRVAEIAGIIAESGIVGIAALITPYDRDRKMARQIVMGRGSRFFEVYVKAPLAVCEQRDPKGLYQRARAGRLVQFTGINSEYEAPVSPDVIVPTDTETLSDCVQRVLRAVT